MNNILLIKTNALFLAIVLIAGTIASISPPFMIGAAQAQTYSGMDNDRKSYSKDNKDKSKDSSKSGSINKIKCINDNIHINGNNTGDINVGNKGQGYSGVYSSADGNGGYGGDDGYSKQGKGFECIINNNNNNINIIGGGGNATNDGNLTQTCETCFTTILTEDELNDLIEATTLPDSLPELCNEFIEENVKTEQGRTFISSYLFTSGMTAGISVDKINAILDCLEEVYLVDFP